MSIRLAAACSPGEIRIAVVDSDRLLDYAIWRPGAPDGLGDLYLGRVEAMLPALGGAFVRLGGASTDTDTGFLPIQAGEPRLLEGDAVPVRVLRSAQGAKGPRLQRVSFDDHDRSTVPRLLGRGADPLTMLAAAHPEAPILADDAGLASELLPALRSRIRQADTVGSDLLQSQIEALAVPEVMLPGGMRASIHPTPALVAIDLDGAAGSAGRQAKQHAQFAANRAAIGPLLHQLRLRNLSGAILIDLAGLGSRKRTALRPAIERALAQDPLAPRLLGFTALGLVEVLRPRQRPPLHELLAGPHAAALAAIRAALRQVAVAPHRLPRLVASLAVAQALERDAAARAALATRAGQPISVRVDASLQDAIWSLENG